MKERYHSKMATACREDGERSSTSDCPVLGNITKPDKLLIKRSFSLSLIELGTNPRNTKGQVNKTTVFDLRCVERFARAQTLKLMHNEDSKEQATRTIASQFKVKESSISICELENTHDVIAVVLPDFVNPGDQTLVIDIYDSLEKVKPDTICTRLHDRANIKELQELIVNEYDWKGVSICKKGRVVDRNLSAKSLALDGLIRLQAVKAGKRDVHVVFQPKPKISYVYTLELDMACHVSALKQLLLKEFADDLLIRTIGGVEMIHLFRHDMSLTDQTCIGIILAGSKDRTLQMHIASRDAICVTLHYREGRAKLQRYQQVSIKPNCSTSDLRAEAAKYLKADPKSIKLTVDNRRIEEDADLKTSGILRKGTVLSAGTKKRKTLQIRHPVTKEEISVKLYMLETVLVLKQEIARQLDLDEFHISLWCKGVEMNDDENLLNYPIKNHMELVMTIHRHRISFWINILFKQTKIKLVVDDAMVIKVSDVLQCCANRYGYNPRFSRAVFQDRCLRSDITLADEGLRQDDTMYVCFFDEPDELPGKFMRAFEVRPDGQTNPRLATVCQGHLCYAPDGITLPAVEEKRDVHTLAETPRGLHVEVEIPRPTENYRSSSSSQNLNAAITDSSRRRLLQRKANHNKAKYLWRARRILNQRTNREQTIRKTTEINGYQFAHTDSNFTQLADQKQTKLGQNDGQYVFSHTGFQDDKEHTRTKTLALNCQHDISSRSQSDQEQTRKKFLLLYKDKDDELNTHTDTIRWNDDVQIDDKSNRRSEEAQTKKKLIYLHNKNEATRAIKYSYQQNDVNVASANDDSNNSVLTACMFGSGRCSTVQNDENVNNDIDFTNTQWKESKDTKHDQAMHDTTRIGSTASHELNNLNNEFPKSKAAVFKKNLSESSAYYTTDVNDSSSSQDQRSGSNRRSGFMPTHQTNYAERRASANLARSVPGQTAPTCDDVQESAESSSMSESVPVPLKVTNKPRLTCYKGNHRLPSASERVSRQGGYKTV